MTTMTTTKDAAAFNAAKQHADGARVASELRAAIIDGEFVPNQRLVEIDLCAQFDASRAAVRSALTELASERLVERVPNRGSRVRAVPLEEAVQISEVRAALEALCAGKAARMITDSEIAEFRTLREEILKAAGQGRNTDYSRLNQLLDRRILDISGHLTAVAVLERLRAQVVRHQFNLAAVPGRALQSAAEHASIIDAVISRDPDAAEQAVREHMRSVVGALQAAADSRATLDFQAVDSSAPPRNRR